MYLETGLSSDTFFFINKTALNNLRILYQWLPPNYGIFFNVVLNNRIFIMFFIIGFNIRRYLFLPQETIKNQGQPKDETIQSTER